MTQIQSSGTFSKVARYVYLAVCLAITCYVMWYAGMLPMERARAVIPYLMLACTIILLDSLIGRSKLFGLRSPLLNRVLSIALIVLVVTSCIYFFQEYFAIYYYRMGIGNIYDVTLGAITLIIVLECCRKNVEKWIMIVAVAFMVYAYIGPYIPIEGLRHAGLPLIDLFRSLSADLPIGIFGDLTQIAFTWISAFVILAAFLRALGGFDTLFNLMRYMVSRGPHLVPQTGVVASALFGMFSGSAPANVAGTGVFTIPMNKRIGVPAKFAGAIESVASSGGLIVPPVMGAAAFIMAAVLGVPYIYICAVAVLPAVLYYLSTSVAVFCISRKYLDLSRAHTFLRDYPKVGLRVVMKVSVPFIVGLALLIFLMAYYRMDPLIACFYTLISYIPLAFVYNYLVVFRGSKEKSSFKDYIKDFAKRSATAVEEGGTLAATVGVMLATINIITGVLTVTGLVLRWSMGLTHAVGYNLALLALAVWLIATLLGFGVSATGVYVITISIATVPFSILNVPPLIVHFFIFWIAVLSAITPPVAIAAATAAKIAEERFGAIAIESVKIGLPLFMICFSFFTWPELLLWSDQTFIAFLCMLFAVIGIPLGIYSSKYLEDVVKRRSLIALIRGALIILSALILVGRPLLLEYFEIALAAIVAAISLWILINESRVYGRELAKYKVLST